MEPQRDQGPGVPAPVTIQSISAITLATSDMARAIRFYQNLGFRMLHGGDDSLLTSFAVGSGYLNIINQPIRPGPCWWGRVIFYVSDVDAMHRHVVSLGLKPEASPRDAEWGERYFHLTDPDGHELSFAQPLPSERRGSPGQEPHPDTG